MMRLLVLAVVLLGLAWLVAPTSAQTPHNYYATLQVERITMTAVRGEQVMDYNLWRGCMMAYERCQKTATACPRGSGARLYMPVGVTAHSLGESP